MMVLLLVSAALADRPTDNSGAWSFDDADEVEYVDGPDGIVRVHYSVSGPNVTVLDDDDASGYPDFAEGVAATAEDVLVFYEAVGFRVPLTEADLGLDALGGSEAFDFYLVDFGGDADGLFATDRCSGGVCAGHMVMENDFQGYGYSSLSEAVRVLTSHELFHAVQAAYAYPLAGWVSEGTAVWAEYQYDDTNDDFVYFCNQYLLDTGRSIYSPPAGSVTSFSYGTALFWQFLTEHLDALAVVELFDAFEGQDADDGAMDVVVTLISDLGSTMAVEWAAFARWNLAVGRRAGEAESYSFAADLRAPSAEAEGEAIEDDNRFYPAAATYYRLDHGGGELFLAATDDPTGIVFTVHAVVDGTDDGPVSEPIDTWVPTEAGTHSFGDLDSGGYWLVGTYPAYADQSVKVAFCFGDLAAVEACEVTPGEDESDPTDETDDAKRGCTHLSRQVGWLGLLPLCVVLALRRRR